jgi:sulfur-oxidizing protein SoxY
MEKHDYCRHRATQGTSITAGLGVTRRAVLIVLGTLGAAAAGGLAAAPGTAHGQVFGQNESVEEAMKRLFGGKTIKDGSAAIKLEVPLIAENGAVVPVSVTVDSPMTPASWVKHIYVVADKNRIPVVTRVTLAPEAGRAFMGANIRLGESGDVRAIVEQSDGTLLQVKREVKVTVGGCGG